MQIGKAISAAFAIAAVTMSCATSPVSMLSKAPPTASTYTTVMHRYWDGRTVPPLQCRGAEVVVDPEYQRPQLMAIGDSLYNGVQSGRINWRLAEWSVPVLVALRLDLIDEQRADRSGTRRFYVPQYPAVAASGLSSGEFGFNLDDAPRLGALLGTDRKIASNLRYLANDYRPPNGRAMVENIAYSGANSIDLVRGTPRRFRAAANVLLDDGRGREAFTYANAAFVLNPTHAPCLEDKTALDQVLLRKPRLLLVSVGANNGIWRAGFYGEPLDPPAEPSCGGDRLIPERCVESMREFLSVTLLNDIRTMTGRLSGVAEIEDVYVNGLIRPSRVANLLPSSNASLASEPDYARTYRLDLFQARHPIPGEQVAATDEFVDRVNQQIREILAQANVDLPAAKFHFVDLDNAIAAYDRKACSGAAWNIVRDGCRSDASTLDLGPRHGLRCSVSLDNFPVRLAGEGEGGRWREGFCAGIRSGGLFSMDNMHPSSAGYAIMAATVREEMARHGDIPGAVMTRGRDCPVDPPWRPQQCTALIVQPGYLTTDNNLRETEFLAWSGTDERRRLAVVRALADFMQNFN